MATEIPSQATPAPQEAGQFETHETPTGGETLTGVGTGQEGSHTQPQTGPTLERDDSSTAPADGPSRPGPERDDSTSAPKDGLAKTGPPRPDSTMAGLNPDEFEEIVESQPAGQPAEIPAETEPVADTTAN